MSSTFRSIAAEVQKAMARRPRTEFARIASEVQGTLRSHTSAQDRDAEWQRVNSYIADVLKDSHVLYAKLARLQGDFSGEELARLSKVSEAVLAIGDELSLFSKAFYDGKYEMLQSEFTYGDKGGAPQPNPKFNQQQPEQLEAGAGGSPAESYDVEVPGDEEEGGEQGGGEEEAPAEEEVPAEEEEQAAE